MAILLLIFRSICLSVSLTQLSNMTYIGIGRMKLIVDILKLAVVTITVTMMVEEKFKLIYMPMIVSVIFIAFFLNDCILVSEYATSKEEEQR
jgi:hypothetical protein